MEARAQPLSSGGTEGCDEHGSGPCSGTPGGLTTSSAAGARLAKCLLDVIVYVRGSVTDNVRTYLVSDFLDLKRNEITERQDELRPIVDEFERLEAADQVLRGVNRGAGATAPHRRGPGRPRGSIAASTASTRRRRPTAGKPGRRARAREALAHVQRQPGITIPELAARMSIKQNYLYRVMPSLEKDGKVAKEGRGWHPAAAEAA
jgi:hypothetical protein